MIPAAFQYTRVTSIDEALDALGSGEQVKLIAGGHSLLPLLKFRLTDLDALVDVSRVAELRGIQKEESGRGVRIGAATTYRELIESKHVAKTHPVMAEVARHIGDLQVRNCGTIGGGLAHADPASDMPALMLALDASLTLLSKKGKRTVAAREFFIGPFETAMKPHEVLTAIVLPPLGAGTGAAYASFKQKASGYALVGAAAVVATSGRKISRADLAFTGLGEKAFLAEAGKQLVGSAGGPEDVTRVAAASVAGVEANDDIHAPAGYRSHLGMVAASRALSDAIARAG